MHYQGQRDNQGASVPEKGVTDSRISFLTMYGLLNAIVKYIVINYGWVDGSQLWVI